MRSKLLIVLQIFSLQCSVAQISGGSTGIIFAKEFSKEIALYSAKTFVIKDVLGESKDVVRFEVDPLAAATSGELTTLVYKCESKKQEGLILGFYGNYRNESGVNYQAYAFKNLPINKANELLDKIEKVAAENGKYIDDDVDNNNIYFNYDDLAILIYNTPTSTKVRVYWKGFDSEWEWTTFKKTKKRLAKKLK